MNLIKTVGNCGLILDTESSSSSEKQFAHATANGLEEPTSHFILNRYRVDDEGNICLRAPASADMHLGMHTAHVIPT